MITQIPLRNFFRNPEKTQFNISPNGKYISFLAPYENRLNVFVQSETQQDEPIRISSQTKRDILSYFWKGSNTLIYTQDTNGDENFHIYAANRDGTSEQDLTPFEGVQAHIIDELPNHDTDMLVALNKENPEIFDVYQLNTQTAQLTLIVKNPGNVASWHTDHNGIIKLATTSDGVNTSLIYRTSENAPFKTIIELNFKQQISPQLFTFDNKHLYALSNVNRDKSALVLFDLENGKELQTIYEHPEVDISGVSYSTLNKKLTTVYYATDKVRWHFLDDQQHQQHQHIETLLGTNLEIYISGHSKDETKLIIRTASDTSLGAYYLYNVESKTIKKLAELNQINPAELCNMQPISYTSRDGLTIHGYLTIPNNTNSKNLPVVLNVHGGPWWRDNWGFNPEVQFLANRGYAVLQINFRGSTGYGRKFLESSFKQWGQTMQNDLSDGVNWLINQGIANPKKVAIYGASYGGYATLAGVTFTPDLYACAIDYVGVSNLITFLETIPPYWKPFLDMMYEMVGHPEHDRQMLEQYSPNLHAHKIKTPLFIAQGANDPRVKKSESDQMVQALKNQGVNVTYMVKDNEGHGFHNQENKFEFYEAMEQFLAQYLK